MTNAWLPVSTNNIQPTLPDGRESDCPHSRNGGRSNSTADISGLVAQYYPGWSSKEHVTMGNEKSSSGSWRLLLKRLGALRSRLEKADCIELTDE